VGGDGETLEALKGFFGSVLPSLGKRDRRQVVGGLAVALGRGGQARVVEASVYKAVQESRGLVDDVAEPGRQCRLFQLVVFVSLNEDYSIHYISMVKSCDLKVNSKNKVIYDGKISPLFATKDKFDKHR